MSVVSRVFGKRPSLINGFRQTPAYLRDIVPKVRFQFEKKCSGQVLLSARKRNFIFTKGYLIEHPNLSRYMARLGFGSHDNNGNQINPLFLVGGLLVASVAQMNQSHSAAATNGNNRMSEVVQSYFDKQDCQNKRTLEEKIACFDHLVRSGERAALAAKNKDIVIFIGNTGAGKSTLINFLYGCEMAENKNGQILVDPKSPIKEVVEVGVRNHSCTLFPKFITVNWTHNSEPSFVDSASKAVEKRSLTFCDMPGFSDNRGFEVTLANALVLKKIIENARSIRFVMVFENGGFAAKGQMWKSSAELLCHRLPGWFKGKMNESDLHLVVTKTTNLTAVKNNINNYSNGLPDFSECASVYDPLNPAHRERYLESILQAKIYPKTNSQIALDPIEFKQAYDLGKEIEKKLDQFFKNKNFVSALEGLKFSYLLADIGGQNLAVVHNSVESSVERYFDKAVCDIRSSKRPLKYQRQEFDKCTKLKKGFNPYLSINTTNKIDNCLNDMGDEIEVGEKAKTETHALWAGGATGIASGLAILAAGGGFLTIVSVPIGLGFGVYKLYGFSSTIYTKITQIFE